MGQESRDARSTIVKLLVNGSQHGGGLPRIVIAYGHGVPGPRSRAAVVGSASVLCLAAISEGSFWQLCL